MGIDWEKIKNEYIRTNVSQRGLAKKYGVSLSSINSRSNHEGWYDEKMKFLSDALLSCSGIKCGDASSGGAARVKRTELGGVESGGSAMRGAERVTESGGSAMRGVERVTESGGSAMRGAERVTESGGSVVRCEEVQAVSGAELSAESGAACCEYGAELSAEPGDACCEYGAELSAEPGDACCEYGAESIDNVNVGVELGSGSGHCGSVAHGDEYSAESIDSVGVGAKLGIVELGGVEGCGTAAELSAESGLARSDDDFFESEDAALKIVDMEKDIKEAEGSNDNNLEINFLAQKLYEKTKRAIDKLDMDELDTGRLRQLVQSVKDLKDITKNEAEEKEISTLESLITGLINI